MQPGARRRARISNGGLIAAGSVWETRMKMDQVRGGIKVFNAEKQDNADEEGIRVYNRRLRRTHSENTNLDPNATTTAGSSNCSLERKKRRNWKPPEPVANGVVDKSPVQLRKVKSEISSPPIACNGEEQGEEEEDDDDDTVEIDEIEGGEAKRFDDKEIDLPKVDLEEDCEVKIQEIKKVPITPDIELKRIEPDIDPVKPQTGEMNLGSFPVLVEAEEEVVEIGSEAPNRMQNIVDLVMWKDISKSAFVFGFGTFILLSSSYAKDLDFSLMSAISYLGLVYLALIFLYRSILKRGAMNYDEREEKYIIGEEEAIWALRFLLPYINEVLIKIKALFSGDPATTMKLALLLFVTARCGNCITLWTLAKFLFFGVFTIPKILSSYSVQLARYGKFWMERFRDGWDSCTHKKAVAAAIFTLIWNISSTVARIWAAFMLVVAMRLYQQCAVEWNVEEEQELQGENNENTVVVQKRQEDSKAGVSIKYSDDDDNNNNNNNNSNNNSRIQLQHRQRPGPSIRSPAGKEKEAATTTKVKKWT